jgi:beta-glucuronidase
MDRPGEVFDSIVAFLLLLLLLLAAAPPGFAAVPAERALYADGPDGRYLLDSGWSTRADPRDAGLRERWQRPARGAGFRPVQLPHSFNARDRSSRGFRSRVQWYRLRFDLPEDPAAVAWRLRFESVNREATVWLNGRRLGSHEGAHLPFELAARSLKPAGNELVVRVDGRMSPSDLPPSSRPRGWWNYGGILREVYLRRVAALDGRDLQVTTVRGNPARIDFRAMARNASGSPQALAFTATLRGPDGVPAGATAAGSGGSLPPGGLGEVSGSFTIPNARSWSPDEPNLYELELRLAGGQTLRAHAGIRDWGVDGAGNATLDGRPLTLRGASFHEETLNRGGALGPAQRDQIVTELQAIAADFAREHYPPHPALLEAFDRAGIVFWEQVPVWRLRARQLGSARLRREALARLRQTVLRDRNHASVMAWSVANETLRGGAAERRYLTAAEALVRRLDPTRLVAVDTSLRPLRDIPSAYGGLDAIGVNEYVGWYGEARNAELEGDLAALRARFPGRALFVTELGAEANRAGPASVKGTFAFQRDWLAEHLGIIDRSPHVSGALVWVLRDFWVRPGWRGGNPRPDAPFNRKGLFDETGAPKAAAELVRERFAAVPPFR